MILYIDTADREKIVVGLKLKEAADFLTVKEVIAPRTQSEKLIPAIAQVLKSQKLSLSDLTKIVVADAGANFTALRIGVATANALAFALGIPVVSLSKNIKTKRSGGISLIAPRYNREPLIGPAKNC